MKVIAKYVTVEVVKDKQVLTLLFPDWNGKRGCLEVVRAHGMKPLTTATGSKVLEMALEDINAETLKCEIGAEIPHDFMLDGDDFTNAYKESEVKDNG
jgi:hypothetical protein